MCRKRSLPELTLPSGYYIEYGGAYAEQQKSFQRITDDTDRCKLAGFSVILFLFQKIKVALLILLIAVLGISGSYLALWLTNTPLNVGSYTGLIMIVGIIGENSIFTFLQFKESLHEKSVDDSIIYCYINKAPAKIDDGTGCDHCIDATSIRYWHRGTTSPAFGDRRDRGLYNRLAIASHCITEYVAFII